MSLSFFAWLFLVPFPEQTVDALPLMKCLVGFLHPYQRIDILFLRPSRWDGKSLPRVAGFRLDRWRLVSCCVDHEHGDKHRHDANPPAPDLFYRCHSDSPLSVMVP